MAEGQRRRYTRKKKAEVVTAALASSVLAVAQAEGIPSQTIDYWMHSEEFGKLREETREARADAAKVISLLAADEIRKRIPTMESKDLINLYGVTVDKGELLSGGATSRTETRDLTAGWDDHERGALKDAIDAELAKREVEA